MSGQVAVTITRDDGQVDTWTAAFVDLSVNTALGMLTILGERWRRGVEHTAPEGPKKLVFEYLGDVVFYDDRVSVYSCNVCGAIVQSLDQELHRTSHVGAAS